MKRGGKLEKTGIRVKYGRFRVMIGKKNKKLIKYTQKR